MKTLLFLVALVPFLTFAGTTEPKLGADLSAANGSKICSDADKLVNKKKAVGKKRAGSKLE